MHNDLWRAGASKTKNRPIVALYPDSKLTRYPDRELTCLERYWDACAGIRRGSIARQDNSQVIAFATNGIRCYGHGPLAEVPTCEILEDCSRTPPWTILRRTSFATSASGLQTWPPHLHASRACPLPTGIASCRRCKPFTRSRKRTADPRCSDARVM